MDELLALDSTALTPLACHSRCAWPSSGCDQALVHGHTDVLMGKRQGLHEPRARVAKRYEAAKVMNDMNAAFDLVDMLYSEGVEELIVDRLVAMGSEPIFVRPYPAFADPHLIDSCAPAAPGPRNAIPYAYAARLQSALGGELSSEIVQAARVGRTKLDRFQRFLWQPSFVGEVDTGRPYVLVDDALAIGGTLAALHAYIVSNGGTVAAITTLVHTSGRSTPFALTEHTRREMYGVYGNELASFWKEVIGHDAECLTEMEGAFLVQWAGDHHSGCGSGAERLLALRNRLVKARDS